MSETVWCVDCGEYKVFDDDAGLCWRCHKDEQRRLAHEVEERRQEFLAEQKSSRDEDIGYAMVQQARIERDWK